MEIVSVLSVARKQKRSQFLRAHTNTKLTGFVLFSGRSVRFPKRTLCVNLRKYLSVYEHFSIGMIIETVLYLVVHSVSI